jgi:hypothetical protein
MVSKPATTYKDSIRLLTPDIAFVAVGFGVSFIVCPVWIGENVHPELRGFFLCLINLSISLGQVVLA